MKSYKISKFLPLLPLVLAFAVTAKAGGDHDWDHHDHDWWHHKPVKAPEIDLSLASGALALLIGGVIVIFGRREQHS